MRDGIDITEAEEGDLPAITALVTELGHEIDGPEATDNKMIERNIRRLFNEPSTHFLVARIKDTVVGFLNFTTRRTIIHSSESGLIDELIVARQHRGKGIGSGLISKAIERCRELGCCEVEVSTLMTNERAREFYKQCGFVEEAVLLEMDIHHSGASCATDSKEKGSQKETL